MKTSLYTILTRLYFQECVHWDIQSHRWSGAGSWLVQTNSSHSTCHFTYLSTYAVIRARVSPVVTQIRRNIQQPLLVPNTRLHQLLIAGVLTLDLIQLREENIQRKVLCKFKLTEIKAFNFYVRKVLIISALELAVN